jgi:hypothetical protein
VVCHCNLSPFSSVFLLFWLKNTKSLEPQKAGEGKGSVDHYSGHSVSKLDNPSRCMVLSVSPVTLMLTLRGSHSAPFTDG